MTQYYSCDSHVVEPPVVFEGLEQRFGSRAPRIVKNPAGKAPGTSVAFGSTLMNVGRLGIAGNRSPAEGVKGGGAVDPSRPVSVPVVQPSIGPRRLLNL